MYVHLISYRSRVPLLVEMSGETTGWRTRWKTVPTCLPCLSSFDTCFSDTPDPRGRGRLVTVFFDVGG